MMQLRWKASFSASCLHAAASIIEGLPIVDHKIAEALYPAAETLVEELGGCGLDGPATLTQLAGLAADIENNHELATMIVRRSLGEGSLSESTITRLAGAITDVEAAWLREQPDLVDELAVRGRPLREQWEARGPGLLRAVSNLTEDDFLAPSAEVILVSPVVGGHGRAHLLINRVSFEAVLTHPDTELPETLRLGWLLSQLNLDVPIWGETVSQQRLPWLAGWATLPLVLAAADSVELARLDEETLARAIDRWYLTPPPSAETPALLLDWWHAYNMGETRWSVALAALDQMLSGST